MRDPALAKYEFSVLRAGALAAMSLAYQQPALGDEITDHCEGEWPTNFQMQEYCMEQQHEALLEVSAFWDRYGITGDNIAQKARRGDVAAGIVAECMRQWDTNYQMVNYCQNQEAEAAQRLGKLGDGSSSTQERRTTSTDNDLVLAKSQYASVMAWRRANGLGTLGADAMVDKAVSGDSAARKYYQCERQAGDANQSTGVSRLAHLEACLHDREAEQPDLSVALAATSGDSDSDARAQYRRILNWLGQNGLRNLTSRQRVDKAVQGDEAARAFYQCEQDAIAANQATGISRLRFVDNCIGEGKIGGQ